MAISSLDQDSTKKTKKNNVHRKFKRKTSHKKNVNVWFRKNLKVEKSLPAENEFSRDASFPLLSETVIAWLPLSKYFLDSVGKFDWVVFLYY